MELPKRQSGVPMTYLVDGKQYIAMAVSARGEPAELVALTLPFDPEHLVEPRSFEELIGRVPQVADVRGVRELRFSFNPDSSGAESDRLMLIEQRRLEGGLPRDRQPQLSYDRLVVVVERADGTEIDWRIVPNPRILRGEWSGPDGTLTGGVYTREADLWIAIPDFSDVAGISLYRPDWTGDEFFLEPYGRFLFSR